MTYWLNEVDKTYRVLVRTAVAQGWKFSRTRQGHPKLTAPDGSYSIPVPGRGREHNGSLRRVIAKRLSENGVDFRL